MKTLKRVWLGNASERPGNNIWSLSMESEDVEPGNEHRRLNAVQNTFPKNPTPEHPQRHVTVLTYLGDEDLLAIRDAINEKLGENS